LGLLRLCGCAQAVGKTGVLGPVYFSLLRSRKRLLAQGIDDFRSALATSYSRAWARQDRKARAPLGRVASKVVGGLEREVTTSVEKSPLRSTEFVSLLLPVRCTTNPLGVKGVGEAGTTASLAAVMNAVADAGANIDMPATPERVWRALSAHGGGT
jgi:hypothetical protein